MIEEPSASNPLCFHSFGDITAIQAEQILSENNLNPGDFILWHNDEDGTYDISCVTKPTLFRHHKKIIHIPIDSPEFTSLVAKASHVKKSHLHQLDPVAYHEPKIIEKNKHAEESENLLDPEVLEKVLTRASECVEPDKGVVICKNQVPELSDRKVVVIFEKKLRIYELLEGESNKLGKGGFSTAFKVRNLRSGHTCARKIFDAEYYSSDEHPPEYEHRILVKIHANGIVPGIQKPFQVSVSIPEGAEKDSFTSFGTCYEGNLRGISSKLSSSNIKSFFAALLEVFEGLKYCHRIQITNNDIKQLNIFYKTKEGGFEFYLADFGGAYDFENLPEHLEIIRTNRYVCADERALVRNFVNKRNEKALFEISKKKDVFALGITCYEMLTNKHPFPERDKDGYVVKTDKYDGKPFQDELVDKYQVPPEIAKKIEKVVKYMLKFDLEGRIGMRQASEVLKKSLAAWDEMENPKPKGKKHKKTTHVHKHMHKAK